MVPNNAHALFDRPLVISPHSTIAIETRSLAPEAVAILDGFRPIPMPSGSRVEITRGAQPVRWVRLDDQPFADRLVHSSACRRMVGADLKTYNRNFSRRRCRTRGDEALLTEISIRDLGVISDTVVEFSPGFTAVTGETGAGKTMVVTSLKLLCGARADADRVRTGADKALVEGRIATTGLPEVDAQALDEAISQLGGERDENQEYLLARQVSARWLEGLGGRALGGRRGARGGSHPRHCDSRSKRSTTAAQRRGAAPGD